MTALPIDQSERLRQGAQIAQSLQEGDQLLENPIGSSVSNVTSMANSGISGLDSLLDEPMADPSDISVLESLQSALSGAIDSSSNLLSHADTLLFGDNAGSLISGGLTPNAGQAIGATNLNDTLMSLVGPIEETCELFSEFFGSVLGVGEMLLDNALDVVTGVTDFITETLETFGANLLGAIGAIVGEAAALIGSLGSVASALETLIGEELAMFADWFARQLNFSFGSFLAGSQDNPCLNMLLDSVGTPILSGLLN